MSNPTEEPAEDFSSELRSELRAALEAAHNVLGQLIMPDMRIKAAAVYFQAKSAEMQVRQVLERLPQ